MEVHPFSELEAKFEKSLHCTSLLLAEENARLPRLQLLLSEHDKEAISKEQSQTKQQLDDVETENSRIREHSARMQHDMEELHKSFQAKIKMIDRLQTELSSMQSLAAEMSKLRAENASLVREISSMKPEITRLRSQNSSYQTILSEKLSLERQVSSLEVELRDAKRNSGKAMTSHLSDRTIMSPEHDVDVNGEPQTSKTSTHTSKSDARDVMVSKKQTTVKVQDSNMSPARHNQTKTSRDASENPPHRLYFGTDASIGTPGPNHVSKLPTKISAAPGDKSIFSITPFLNRQSHDFAVNFTSSESDGDGLSFAKANPSKLKGKNLPPYENEASTTNTRKSNSQPLKNLPKSTNIPKIANGPAPRAVNRSQKQKDTKDLSEDDGLPDPVKKRRILRTIGDNPSLDDNFGPLRSLSKQHSHAQDRSGIFADPDGKRVENDRRNRRLGLNKPLEIPPFSPLKRNIRPS
ncbi:hypothetical protein GTR04_5013 [Trichophyton interdigitale]|uniref:Uncharacterized protein n=1 Tax=Trichophyton interdigitale TaxID=101480 RepID=A0A9P4YDP6_9EURO|nr:hypothetical protein GY632_4639 [Trichophyton interdigitale]KAF3895989.1 hypothetical protein GY631_2284 [Trichophyton interdigitale]KAG8207607.1 hypothetical protein GTR04_5013 [Trichophyton interdigitale]